MEVLQEILRFGLPILTGAVCGIVFGLLRLPIPAPPVVEGILGIVGIFMGYILVTNFIK